MPIDTSPRFQLQKESTTYWVMDEGGKNATALLPEQRSGILNEAKKFPGDLKPVLDLQELNKPYAGRDEFVEEMTGRGFDVTEETADHISLALASWQQTLKADWEAHEHVPEEITLESGAGPGESNVQEIMMSKADHDETLEPAYNRLTSFGREPVSVLHPSAVELDHDIRF